MPFGLVASPFDDTIYFSTEGNKRLLMFEYASNQSPATQLDALQTGFTSTTKNLRHHTSTKFFCGHTDTELGSMIVVYWGNGQLTAIVLATTAKTNDMVLVSGGDILKRIEKIDDFSSKMIVYSIAPIAGNCTELQQLDFTKCQVCNSS